MNRSNKKIEILTAALIICMSAQCHGGLVLELASAQQVSGPEIMLKDIVKDPSSLPEEWKEREVMKAPETDIPVEYGISALASALQKYPDMQDVTLKGQIKISIKRTAPQIGMDRIEKAIREYVAEASQWKGRKVEIHCEPITEKTSIMAENPAIEVIKSTPGKQENKYSFIIAISENDSIKQSLTVKASVVPMIEVWIARKTLSKGDAILAPENVETQYVAADSSRSLVPAAEQIDGLVVSTAIDANQPINRNYLVPPVCSQSGDQLSVNVEREGLRVMLRAKALSSGRKGERIMCMNEQSKKRLLVKLTGPREATIEF